MFILSIFLKASFNLNASKNIQEGGLFFFFLLFALFFLLLESSVVILSVKSQNFEGLFFCLKKKVVLYFF